MPTALPRSHGSSRVTLLAWLAGASSTVTMEGRDGKPVTNNTVSADAEGCVACTWTVGEGQRVVLTKADGR